MSVSSPVWLDQKIVNPNDASLLYVQGDSALLSLPIEVLAIIASGLASRNDLESGREIASFSQVCKLTDAMAKRPELAAVIAQAKKVKEMKAEARAVSNYYT
jgi:hypothetical protein